MKKMMAARQAQKPHLVASLVENPAHIFGSGDLDPGRVEGIVARVLTYADGPVPLARSPLWRKGPKLIARHVAECLRMMQKDRGPLMLVFNSPPLFERRLGARTYLLTSAEEVLLDWGLRRRGSVAGLVTPIHPRRGSKYAEAVVQIQTKPELRAVDRLVVRYFDQYSFSGYVLGAGAKWVPRDLLDGVALSARVHTRLKVLRSGGIYFEDWDDGCGLKIWMQSVHATDIDDLIPLDKLAKLLS
jgi:hypothetical protein